MKTATGIFSSREDAQNAAGELRIAGVPEREISLLMPGAVEELERRVPTTETEGVGEGAALGGVVGGAIGLAGGFTLGTAAVTALSVPLVGPVAAVGIAAAALFGAGGALAGAAAGSAIDETADPGIPRDEVFFYEEALRHGRSLVLVMSDDEETISIAKRTFAHLGGGDIGSARDSWWADVRSRHLPQAAQLGPDEMAFRRGFEAALDPSARGRSFEDARSYLEQLHPDVCRGSAFRRGYEQGLRFHHDLVRRHEEEGLRKAG